MKKKGMKTAIFVERIWDDQCFSRLKEFCLKRGPDKIKLYCITPANYYLSVAEQGYMGSKEEFSQKLAERYRILAKLGFKINLHLHLSLMPEKLTKKQNMMLFLESLRWMDMLGLNPKEIMFGWYLYDRVSEMNCWKYKIKIVKNKSCFQIHDYQLDKPFTIMNILATMRNWFRR